MKLMKLIETFIKELMDTAFDDDDDLSCITKLFIRNSRNGG